MRSVNRACIILIRGLRPLLGPACCRFYVSCTTFAIQQLKERPFFPAIWAIVCRLICCSPLQELGSKLTQLAPFTYLKKDTAKQ